jgi:hypothetical protein
MAMIERDYSETRRSRNAKPFYFKTMSTEISTEHPLYFHCFQNQNPVYNTCHQTEIQGFHD